MPTTLPKRRSIRRDRRLELSLLGLVVIELVAMSAAGARPTEEQSGHLLKRMARMTFACTVAEVPCDMLAP